MLKPGSVNVSEYVPGFRPVMRYCPAPSVTARAHLFDERGAGRLDGHAGQDAARFVPDGSCKSALCKGQGRQQDSRRQNQHQPSTLRAWGLLHIKVRFDDGRTARAKA